MASAFGYAEIIALSQSGIQAAEQAFLEDSSCILQASWFDADRSPYLPNRVSYQLVDVESQTVILPWASLGPATSNSVTVTSPQNAMINQTRGSETHKGIFQITDQNDTVFYAEVDFDIVRVAGLA